MFVERTVRTQFGGCTSITEDVAAIVSQSGIRDGYCAVSLKGLTAGLAITSFWDPRGLQDLMHEIERNIPARVSYHNQTTPFDASGQSKGALVGRSVLLLVKDGKMVLGSSQGIVLLEFDGPRDRSYTVSAKKRKLTCEYRSLTTEFMGMHDLTGEIKKAVAKSGVSNGLCHISQLHSTAGLLLGSRKSACSIMEDIERIIPTRGDFLHRETAADAGGHVKTAVTGSQLSLPILDKKLKLGDNQAVWFAEYDGPRPRRYVVGIMENQEREETGYGKTSI